MTDLLHELRRSSDRRDRELADVLGRLSPARSARRATGPRASDPLAAFLAAQQVGPAAPSARPLAARPDLVVVIGPPAGPPRTVARALVPAALWAKAVLAAAAAVATVGLAAWGAPSYDVAGTPAGAPSASGTTTPATPAGADAEPTPRAQPPVLATTSPTDRPRATPGREQARSATAGLGDAAPRAVGDAAAARGSDDASGRAADEGDGAGAATDGGSADGGSADDGSAAGGSTDDGSTDAGDDAAPDPAPDDSRSGTGGEPSD